MKTLDDFKQEQMKDEDFKREYDEIQFIANSRAIQELEKIEAEIREWYWQADKQKISKDPCVVDAMIDLFIRTIDNRIVELKGENNEHNN